MTKHCLSRKILVRRILPGAVCALSALAATAPARAQARMELGSDGLPGWVHEVGARSEPTSERIFSANAYGAVGDGEMSSTAAIQKAIDAAFRAGGGTVTLEPGSYVTGSLFVKSSVHLRIDPGVTLLGSQNDADYPSIWTRVAGIEMEWPAALINVNNQRNVKISGGGTIDGRGEKWWSRYWDMRRNDYEPRGLRWAVDYDAERPRLMVVWRSRDVTVENLHLKRSGFWTVQVAYSEDVTVDGVTVRDNQGPSTDGINIDSSRRVLVQNNDIDNNDDNICLKSGRDADGLRVDRPTEYVVIRNNVTRRGAAIICIGSETSGGIRNVVAYDNRGIGTKEGVRFKSAKTRGGVVENILIRGLKMENVPLAFTFVPNWNPSYSYATLPESMEDVPDHWVVLNTPVPPELALPEFRNVTIENVEVVGAERIFTASGLPTKPLSNFLWRNITAQGKEAGFIEHARNWEFENVRIRTPSGEEVKVTDSERVEGPEVVGR
jgi:polygalacturonase